jgi:GDP-4-dehydro-6-deoxy-D-mannose reductase
MRVLITGIAGFVGSHLAEYALKKNAEVFGTILPNEPLNNIAHIKKQLKLFKCDITKPKHLNFALKKSRPDLIFHLAAQSNVSLSWKIPQKTMQVNVIGTINLLESLRKYASDARVLLASSREVYGRVRKSELPVTEKQPPKPVNPYGVSKLAMELLGMQYYQKYGLYSIIVRSFNLTGPRRPASFACSDWAKQLAEIELSLKEPVLEIGIVTALRDFTDVRDAVRAYWLAIHKCKPAEPYNVCSGKSLKMKKVLEMILSLSNKKIKVVRDDKKVVKIDIPYAVGSNSKLRKATAWQPKIKFKKTLRDLVAYWKKQLSTMHKP